MAGIGFRTLEAVPLIEKAAKPKTFIYQTNKCHNHQHRFFNSVFSFLPTSSLCLKIRRKSISFVRKGRKVCDFDWFRWSFDKPWIDLVSFLLRFEGLKEEEEGKNTNGLCWIHTVARRRWDHHSIISLGSLVDWA